MKQLLKSKNYLYPAKSIKSTAEYNLTKRELEICELITKGLSNQRIAKHLYISEGTVKNHLTEIYIKLGVRNRVQLTTVFISCFGQAVTEYTTESSTQAEAKFRLIGIESLPDIILLAFSGSSFIIGRFDVSVGRKQCDFEFGKATKAVSRRHAAIERTSQGYTILDLNSRAGTFINGVRIMPGEQHSLKHGDHVSFGNAGADYIFEC